MVQRRGGCVIDLEEEAKTGHRCKDDLGLGEKDVAAGTGVVEGGCTVSLEVCRKDHSLTVCSLPPCCELCPYCNQRILYNLHRFHVERCAPEHNYRKVDSFVGALVKKIMTGK